MDSTEGSGFDFSTHAYDNIYSVYQDALVSHHEHVKNVLDRLTSSGTLKPNSRILEVGCGTGKPITSYFVDHGHQVTAIDLSTGMLSLARKNAPKATFLQVDMTSWDPSDAGTYDMVMASHCLYTLSIAQIRSLLYKFTRWVKVGGIVVVGMSHNQETLKREKVWFDEDGWAEGFRDTFLGYKFRDSTFGREDAWVNLIKSTGLEIVHVDRTVCLKADDPDQDAQFYIISKKVHETSLIGPFPIPETYTGPVKFQSDAWAELGKRLDAKELTEVTFKALLQEPSCRKVLSVSDSAVSSAKGPVEPSIEIQQTSELSSNVQLGSFDGVILGGVLHTVPSPEEYIDYAIRAIASTGHGRILVIEGAPDNELTDILNRASQGLNLTNIHHGYLLKEAEKKLKAAGFRKIEYIHVKSPLDFGSLQGEERITYTSRLLARLRTHDAAVQTQLEERLRKSLKVQFLFKSNGELATQAVILVAERN